MNVYHPLKHVIKTTCVCFPSEQLKISLQVRLTEDGTNSRFSERLFVEMMFLTSLC